MGFSRDKIRAEAKRSFKGLEIDDVPGGPVVLRSPLSLSDDEQEALTAIEKRVNAMQDEGGTLADLRTALVDQAVLLADQKDGFPEYLADFSTAELAAMFSLYRKQVQAGEAKSGR